LHKTNAAAEECIPMPSPLASHLPPTTTTSASSLAVSAPSVPATPESKPQVVRPASALSVRLEQRSQLSQVVTLGQQFKSINNRINPSKSLNTSGAFDEEMWKKHPLFNDTVGDSSQSGDEEDNGWKALRLLQPTEDKQTLLSQAQQILKQ